MWVNVSGRVCKTAGIEKMINRVASLIHWELCALYGFKITKNEYNHSADAVLANDKIKLLWDFNIHTDRVIEARPNIIF